MSVIFEYIQDLYQRSIQKNSSIKYKSKLFIQKILYTFDELYRTETIFIQKYNEKTKHIIEPIEKYYPNITYYWCKEFCKYYNELNMYQIINDYYKPIDLRKEGNYNIKLKTLLGKSNNKCYIRMKSHDLFPKIFHDYIHSNNINGKQFFMNTEHGKNINKSTLIEDFINGHIDDNMISDEISNIISNIKYVPDNIPLNIKFIHNIVNFYKPTYADFLINYVRNWKFTIIESNDVISNLLVHICYSNEEPLDQLIYIKVFKAWYSEYMDENSIKHKRNICKGFNFDILLKHV